MFSSTITHNKCDITRLTNQLSTEWLGTLRAFKTKAHTDVFSNLVFERATFRQLFVAPKDFTREDYIANCHLLWNVDRSPDRDYRKDYPQQLMAVLICLMCHELLQSGGSLVIPTVDMETYLFEAIRKMFTTYNILSDNHALVATIIQPFANDNRAKKIAVFQGFIV